MPFPGYEYFGQCTFNAKKLCGSNQSQKHHKFMGQAFDTIKFAWDNLCSSPNNVSKILSKLPENTIHPQVNEISWNEYQNWHINDMTKNYLKLLISSFAAKGDVTDEPFNGGGVLVHCIMGWD